MLVGAALAWKGKLDHVMPPVEYHQDGCVLAALANAGRRGATVEHKAETLRAAFPIGRRHFASTGIDPGQLLDIEFLITRIGQEAPTAQNREAAAQGGDSP